MSSSEEERVVASWQQQNADMVLARQRAQVDTSKLVVTFTLAIAATLDATALQVTGQRSLDIAATVALGAGFVATLIVIGLDRLKEPDRLWALARARRKKFSDAQLVELMQDLSDEVERFNESIVARVRLATQLQILVAVICGFLATFSLLAE